jgi:hypothetical protein
MPADYKKMYHTLFNSQTKAIELLQAAQQTTEEMFIEASDTDIRVLPPREPDDEKPDGDQ